jgi:hypothetical protein
MYDMSSYRVLPYAAVIRLTVLERGDRQEALLHVRRWCLVSTMAAGAEHQHGAGAGAGALSGAVCPVKTEYKPGLAQHRCCTCGVCNSHALDVHGQRLGRCAWHWLFKVHVCIFAGQQRV